MDPQHLEAFYSDGEMLSVMLGVTVYDTEHGSLAALVAASGVAALPEFASLGAFVQDAGGYKLMELRLAANESDASARMTIDDIARPTPATHAIFT